MTRELTHLFAWALGEKPDAALFEEKVNQLDEDTAGVVRGAACYISRRASPNPGLWGRDYAQCLAHHPETFRYLALAFAAAIEAMHEQVEAP